MKLNQKVTSETPEDEDINLSFRSNQFKVYFDDDFDNCPFKSVLHSDYCKNVFALTAGLSGDFLFLCPHRLKKDNITLATDVLVYNFDQTTSTCDVSGLWTYKGGGTKPKWHHSDLSGAYTSGYNFCAA